jgi:triosephosphate isomerase
VRRPLVAGNWKMNLDLASARELVSSLAAKLPAEPSAEILVCPPFIYLFPMAKAVNETPIRMGAQNLWPEPKGAFTGECSARMVRKTGCTHVILGHSERRHTIGWTDPEGSVHGEDDSLINRKVHAALGEGLVPVFCVGETLRQRDKGEMEAVISRQVVAGLNGLRPEQVAGLVIAYEPVWAIGTGRTASPEQAAEAHRHIRRVVFEQYGGEAAAGVRILYGGSVTPENAESLMNNEDVDGVLVGGASLHADDFFAIIQACISVKDRG